MYEHKTRVGFSQVGPEQKLKMFGLMNILQDATCFHSDSIGYGLEWLAPKGMGWFVTNYEIHINQMPCYGQEITVRTYAISFKGMLGTRCFDMLDEKGNVLVYATSLWVLMDLNKLAPVRVPAQMSEAYGIDGPLEYEFCGKRMKALDNAKKAGEFTVDKMYIDTNGHMNNSIYIDVTSRFLPEGFDVSCIMINYKKAAQLGDVLDVCMGEVENGCQILLKKGDEVYTIVEYLR